MRFTSKGFQPIRSARLCLADVAVRDGGSFGTVKGYFDTPDIADDLIDEDDDDADDETEETKPSENIPCAGDTDRSSKESTHSETEYSQMETKQTERRNEDRCGVS